MARYMAGSIVAVALALGACADSYIAPTDFERLGTWQAEGINDRNLRAMVADPSHLTRGVGAATDRGSAGAQAVAALDACRRPILPRSDLTEIGSGNAANDTSVSAAGCAEAGASGGRGGGASGGGGSGGGR